MPKVIVPVGLLLGAEFGGSGPPDRDPQYWEVHLGPDPQRLSTEELIAWAGAYRTPQEQAELRVDRESLEQSLRSGDGRTGSVADPTPIVSGLVARGLLVEYDPVDGALTEPFRRLRLFPQGQGLGSSSHAPNRYHVGFAGYPLAKLSKNVYQLWWSSLGADSLWDACLRLATSDSANERAEELAREIGAALPQMISVGAAFLDPALEPAAA